MWFFDFRLDFSNWNIPSAVCSQFFLWYSDMTWGVWSEKRVISLNFRCPQPSENPHFWPKNPNFSNFKWLGTSEISRYWPETWHVLFFYAQAPEKFCEQLIWEHDQKTGHPNVYLPLIITIIINIIIFFTNYGINWVENYP